MPALIHDRARRSLPLLGLLLLGLGMGPACAGRQKTGEGELDPGAPELELTLDDGQPVDRPQLPPPDSEWLVRFDPGVPAFRPVRLRLLVAQPGKLKLTLYPQGPGGRPGAPLRTVDKDVAATMTSGGHDGKWLVVGLTDVPAQRGPLFLGISSPESGAGAARLWVAANPDKSSDPDRPELAPVFRRDPEPSTALQSTRLPLVPLARLVISPTAPPATAPEAAKP